MQWEGAEGWKAAQDLDWEVDGKSAGTFTKSGPLSFVKVFEAGHMVCMLTQILTMKCRWLLVCPVLTMFLGAVPLLQLSPGIPSV